MRIDYPGAFHHVMNRGARRANVFLEDEHCDQFLKMLANTVERFDIRAHGFALMPNHYHLMVESVHGNLSKAMAQLSSWYTQAFNWEVNTDGSVFRGRFHNRVVIDPSHWRYLLAYMHLNPVRARMVPRVDQWRWTSHRYYSGKVNAPDWLWTGQLLKELGGAHGYRQYVSEVRQGRREMPDGFDQVLFGRQRSSDLQIVKHPENARELTVDRALEQVLKVSGKDRDEIYREVRGRGGNPVRTIAAWWLAVGAGCSNREVGRQLKMSEVSVSRALGRVRRELKARPLGELYDWAHKLRETKTRKVQVEVSVII